MGLSGGPLLLSFGLVLLFLAKPSHAFGAGNIIDVSNVEGHNWRHGDIEDTLLQVGMTVAGSKFGKLDVKRVYFGNWLRDYSQAIDVGGLKQLPAETIRILLWVLSFMTFGYATAEFEVSAERLGCYRPEEHIDNPKDYADNEDARHYDQRLRGPVNNDLELKVDPNNALKTYIASEGAGCDTSAGLVRRLFEKCIELGRKYKKDKNKADLYESLRLLGTGLHCLEDFAAHSNYVELVLRDMQVDAFPHVGKNTELDCQGKKVFPVVTGTFGMTDFLHSVVGEVGDKMAQSEVEALDDQLSKAEREAQGKDQLSILKMVLDQVPWDMLEGDSKHAKPDPAQAEALKKASEEQAAKNAANPTVIAGVNVEEAKKQAQETLKAIYPILEWHDTVMKAVNVVISKVPGLDELLDNLSGAMQIYVYSLLAPFIRPILEHVRLELIAGSEGLLKSEKNGQYQVFNDDGCSDPTHSMLSKDHFSNVLNPVAGQVASSIVKHTVPLLVAAWEDEGKDVKGTIDDILQVFHHPALRDENKSGQKEMYETVKRWWEGKSESDKQHLKDCLSRDGVQNGKNHEEGHADDGHGHGAPKKSEAQEMAGEIKGLVGGLLDMAIGGNTSKPQGRQTAGSNQTYGGGSTGTYGGTSGSGRRPDVDYEASGRSSYQQGGQTPGGRSHGSSGNTYGESEDTYGGGSSGRTHGGTHSGRQQTSPYGRDTEDTSTSGGYGQSTSSYGRDTEESTSRYDTSETTSYGRNTGSSRYDNDTADTSYSTSGRGGTSGGYGRGGAEETSGSRYGQSTSYGRDTEDTSSSRYGGGGRDETSSYGRGTSSRYDDTADTSSYSTGGGGRHTGSSRYEAEDTSTSGYGGGGTTGSSRYDTGNTETSGYGGGRNTETSGYGGGRDTESSGYGDTSSSRYDNSSSGGRGGGGGYGSSRRQQDDDVTVEDDTNGSSRYGTGRGSSRRHQDDEETSGGYGGSSGY